MVEGGEEAPDLGGEGKTVVVVDAVGLADGDGVTYGIVASVDLVGYAIPARDEGRRGQFGGCPKGTVSIVIRGFAWLMASAHQTEASSAIEKRATWSRGAEPGR